MMQYEHTMRPFCLAIVLLTLFFVQARNLFAQTSGQDLRLRTVVIDPGHGGKDPGALGRTSDTNEKHIVMSVAKQLGSMIKAECPDVKVVYTREDNDTFIGLHERAMIARKNNAGLFISLHCNSSSNKTACGSSVHILGKKSKNSSNKTDYFEKNSVAQRENGVIVLEDDYQTKYKVDPNSPEAYIIHSLQWMAFYESSLNFATEVVDKLMYKPLIKRTLPIEQDVFQVLVEANMPAVLIELAFISNQSEYKYLASEAGQKEIASRLLKAFKKYKANCDASVSSGGSAPQSFQDAVQETSCVSEESAEYFGIQIMGLGRLLKKGDPALKGLDAAAIKPPGSNIYKYVTGNYATRQQAGAALGKVRAKFPEAFVVKVNGNTVSRP